MTQSNNLPKRWFVPYPEKKGKMHPCQIACGGSQKMGFLLHYFLYEASWELERQNLPESCKVVVLTRSHKEILQQVNISQKSLIEFLKTFNEWGFVLNERYSKTFAVQHDPIKEAMYNPKSCKVEVATSTFSELEEALQRIKDLEEKSCKVEVELKQLQQVQLYNFTLESRLEAMSQEIEDLKAKSCKVYPNVEALQLYNFSSDWLQAVSDALGIPFPSRDIERDITKENKEILLGDFVVTPSPQGDNETEYQQFHIDTDATECIAGMTTGNDLEDDPEITAKRPVVVLPQGEGNTRHGSHSDPTDSDVPPGSAHDGTSQSEQGRAGVHSCLPSDIDATHTSGVAHDDTPATTHPSVPVGTDRATDTSFPASSRNRVPDRWMEEILRVESSAQQTPFQAGQEAAQVQMTQHTTQVPPAAVPPSLHPSQQATNAPVASTPPDGVQRGAGGDKPEKPKRTRTRKPVQPTQERLPEPVFTLTEQQQHFWEMWCNIWFNQGVPLHLTKTAYGHVDTLAPIITTPEQLESLTKKARQDLEATTGIGRKTVQLGNCVYSLPGWRQDQPPEQRNGHQQTSSANITSYPTISGRRRLDDDVPTPIDYTTRAAFA